MNTQNTSCVTCHPIAHHHNIEDSLGNILKRTWENLTAYMKRRQQRRIDRQAFQNLMTLDDHILKDIGLTRTDGIWANQLPLSQNAAVELEKIARQNRTNF